MSARGLLGIIVTGGLAAAIGYMLKPRRKNRFFSYKMMMRSPLPRIGLKQMSRMLMRQVAKAR